MEMYDNSNLFSTGVPSKKRIDFINFLYKKGITNVVYHIRGGYTTFDIDLSRVENPSKLSDEIDFKVMEYQKKIRKNSK